VIIIPFRNLPPSQGFFTLKAPPGAPDSMETDFMLWIHSLANPFWDAVFEISNIFGRKYFIALVVIGCTCFHAWRRETNELWIWLTLAALALGGCLGLKEGIARPRPELWPWMVSVSLLHAPPEDIARYRGQYNEGWRKLRERRHQRQLELGLVNPSWNLPAPDPEVGSWDDQADPEWQDLRMAVYAAMVDRMDQNIGRFLQALEDVDQANNTVVCFLSDNGGCSEAYAQDIPGIEPGLRENYTTCGPDWAYAQNTPFRRYKTWMHEGGISTPMIARWPGHIRPGTLTRQVGHIIDFMPTFIELAEGRYPEQVDGRPIVPVEGLSLVPIFEGKQRAGHPSLWWEFAGNRAVREGNWKLCWDKKVREWELYQLAEDRTETHNLAAWHPGKVQALSQSWQHWALRTGVISPTPENPSR